jgi:hypothetical protein
MFLSVYLPTQQQDHTRKERLTDAASSTQQSELVFHNSVSAERLWKTAVPYWDLVPNPPSLPLISRACDRRGAKFGERRSRFAVRRSQFVHTHGQRPLSSDIHSQVVLSGEAEFLRIEDISLPPCAKVLRLVKTDQSSHGFCCPIGSTQSMLLNGTSKSKIVIILI